MIVETAGDLLTIKRRVGAHQFRVEVQSIAAARRRLVQHALLHVSACQIVVGVAE